MRDNACRVVGEILRGRETTGNVRAGVEIYIQKYEQFGNKFG